MLSPKKESALLILSHGSTVNPDSSTPAWNHFDEINKLNEFSSVHCAFWKEEPSFRQILSIIEEKHIYAVPNFISQGYFTNQIIPRELELKGEITENNEHLIYYCDPVGIHTNMTKFIIDKVCEIKSLVPLKESSLIIVGHGTALDSKSSDSIEAQVNLIKSSYNMFGEVIDLYMDQPPFIKDWEFLTNFKNVIIMPFFISNGLHTKEDIPRLLKINLENQDNNFIQIHKVSGKNLFYSSAIGTLPDFSNIIINQVDKFREKY